MTGSRPTTRRRSRPRDWIAAGFALAAVAGAPAEARQVPEPEGDVAAPATASPPDTAQSGDAAQTPPPEPAEKPGFFHRNFIDEQDHRLDLSNFLARGGFIPVPIIITEPAVDGGYGAAAAFLTVDPQHPRRVTKRIIGGFETGNGSSGVGYFQNGFLFDGRLNYRFGIGRGTIILDTFPTLAPQGVSYESDYDYGVIGSVLWGIDDHLSVGPLFDFRKLSVSADFAGLPPEIADDLALTLQTGALGLGAHYDTRDNSLTPTRGLNAEIEAKFNRDAFGSDRDYETYEGNLFVFRPLRDDLNLGFKLEGDAVRGDFPFFYAPAIDLRGVEAMRYQGVNVASTEVEVVWRVNPRWSVLAFAGVGAAEAGDSRLFADSGAQWAGGAGFRYRLARKLGFDAGVDFAWGPDGFIFYLQFGHAWAFRMD